MTTSHAPKLALLDELLAEQRTPSAVERFALEHDAGRVNYDQRYRSRLPATAPGPDQQYAFEVDLDACTGCKGCVTACHSLNGLEAGETWRQVGTLIGGGDERAVRQTVTTACHHCLEPACLRGCPVNAYEKDAATGIVFHLDDQCIGCQYCIFTCPYEVPQYSAAKGIVRKCDMCRHRLEASEAPACVQACPNGAITIGLRDVADTLADAETGAFLPAAPDPALTLPTTAYHTRRPLPRNTLPMDYYAVRREHAHPALVAMLVLTQIAVGLYCLAHGLGGLGAVATGMSLAVAAVALGASTLHLGRPLYAFRAVLGVRCSWLSREILAFGAFVGLAGAQVAAALASMSGAEHALGLAAAVVGALAVGCSIMVYAVTGRATWRWTRTTPLFLGTSLAGGAAALAATLIVSAAVTGQAVAPAARTAALVACLAALAKLGWEAAELAHARARRHTPLRRRALLLLGDLRRVIVVRLAAGALGAALALAVASRLGPASPGLAVLAVAAALLIAAGELCERHTYFVAAAAPRMPGELP